MVKFAWDSPKRLFVLPFKNGFMMIVSFCKRIKKRLRETAFGRRSRGTALAWMAGVNKLWRVKYDY